MSADNFVQIRKKSDGKFWWGEFSESERFREIRTYQDEEFDVGPFDTPNQAEKSAEEELQFIEYGVEWEETWEDEDEDGV